MATCNWTRRFDAVSLPRWTANKEFEQLALAIIRNLPFTEPSVLTVKGLRRMLNEVAIEAIETGAERITDEASLLSDGHRREELFCLTIGT
jgi:hypothetical protein